MADEIDRHPPIRTVVELLHAAIAEASARQDRPARSLLEPLLAHALQCQERLQAGQLGGLLDRRIERALQLMRDRPAARWTVEALAKAAGLSRAAFARRFLAELGRPPLRWLAELRMQRAAELLAGSDESLAAIAAEVGYDSEFAFSRAFKRHTGEAPGVYRRSRRVQGGGLGTPPVRAAA